VVDSCLGQTDVEKVLRETKAHSALLLLLLLLLLLMMMMITIMDDDTSTLSYAVMACTGTPLYWKIFMYISDLRTYISNKHPHSVNIFLKEQLFRNFSEQSVLLHVTTYHYISKTLPMAFKV
jgi:hypothetical protein